MARTIEAVFERGVFRPRQPVALPEGQAVQVVLPEDAKTGRRPRDERLRRHFGTWRSGDKRSADNERIDADLAREHGKGR